MGDDVQRTGTALVTGASRGIGRAVAVELAQRGWRVLATMRDPSAGADLADVAGGSITVTALDVTRPESIELPTDLRVVVNNAGIERSYDALEHTPLREWREVYETNVFGLVEVARRAVPLLRRNGGGVICNLTSASLAVPMPFYAVYRSSKAAVAALTECLAEEVAGFGIRVLEVAPGPIDTEMLAASGRVPEAVRHEAYEELAHTAHRMRHSIDAFTTPVADAAAAMVDAIEDPQRRGRVTCDPLGAQLMGA